VRRSFCGERRPPCFHPAWSCQEVASGGTQASISPGGKASRQPFACLGTTSAERDEMVVVDLADGSNIWRASPRAILYLRLRPSSRGNVQMLPSSDHQSRVLAALLVITRARVMREDRRSRELAAESPTALPGIRGYLPPPTRLKEPCQGKLRSHYIRARGRGAALVRAGAGS
jgi:hypothetical protein